jgi:hypothetical protein
MTVMSPTSADWTDTKCVIALNLRVSSAYALDENANTAAVAKNNFFIYLFLFIASGYFLRLIVRSL